MKRNRERKTEETVQLSMAPMIDVVFLLLIFFIVTLKQEDILSHLDIMRPAPDPNAKIEEQVKDLLDITVYNHRKLGGQGFLLQGKRVSLKTLDKQLTRLASYSKDISVIIRCTGDSPHSNLIHLLNICAKAEMKNLSVFSM